MRQTFERFEYVFDFADGPMQVEIILHYEKAFGAGWVFVKAIE